MESSLYRHEGCVYHMTCRGSRFADGAKRNPNGEVFMKNRETDEWLKQNIRSSRNFVRKWGHYVKHDTYLKPIIPPKFDIGISVENCSPDLLKEIEPWCTTVYCDYPEYQSYIEKEQPNTSFDLNDRVKSFNDKRKNAILVEIDATKFTPNDFGYLQMLGEVIENDEQLNAEPLPATFALGNLRIVIISMDTSENNLIVCKGKQ